MALSKMPYSAKITDRVRQLALCNPLCTIYRIFRTQSLNLILIFLVFSWFELYSIVEHERSTISNRQTGDKSTATGAEKTASR
jgi:ABC-type microcin C transport system permease subunit YejE